MWIFWSSRCWDVYLYVDISNNASIQSMKLTVWCFNIILAWNNYLLAKKLIPFAPVVHLVIFFYQMTHGNICCGHFHKDSQLPSGKMPTAAKCSYNLYVRFGQDSFSTSWDMNTFTNVTRTYVLRTIVARTSITLISKSLIMDT